MTNKILIDRALLDQVLDVFAKLDDVIDGYYQPVEYLVEAEKALRTALEQPDMGNLSSAPEGWKLVPVEPTRAMMDAYARLQGRFNSARSDWAAMINASPQSPVVEQPLKDQLVDWPEVDRLLKTVKYLIGIAERGTVRKMRDDETVEQFVLSYVQALEQQQCEAFCFCDNDISLQSVSGGGASEGLYGRITLKIGSEFVSYVKEQPQVEQEPVAWRLFDGDPFPGTATRYVYYDKDDFKEGVNPTEHFQLEPLYTHSQNLSCKSTQARLATLWGYEKPQPKREPLTDEQIACIAAACGGLASDFVVSVARAIEAAHGVKGRK